MCRHSNQPDGTCASVAWFSSNASCISEGRGPFIAACRFTIAEGALPRKQNQEPLIAVNNLRRSKYRHPPKNHCWRVQAVLFAWVGMAAARTLWRRLSMHYTNSPLVDPDKVLIKKGDCSAEHRMVSSTTITATHYRYRTISRYLPKC